MMGPMGSPMMMGGPMQGHPGMPGPMGPMHPAMMRPGMPGPMTPDGPMVMGPHGPAIMTQHGPVMMSPNGPIMPKGANGQPMGPPSPSWKPEPPRYGSMDDGPKDQQVSNDGDDETEALEKFKQLSPEKQQLRIEGALQTWQTADQTKQQRLTTRRTRINCVPTLLAIFIPWLVFLAVFLWVAFDVHYLLPITTNVVMLALLFMVIARCKSAHLLYKCGGDWFFPAYISGACLLVVVAGWVMADINFWQYLQPAINAEKLATYVNVDPSSEMSRKGIVMPTPGKRYQDAGRIMFNSDAVLDHSKSMAYKLGDLYCVTPIVNPNCHKNCGYDFWAVGINCCSEDASDFRCGEFNNPKAKAGIRQMFDWNRQYFRLAVLEAEGAHDIQSSHPLFFTWVEDPIHTVHGWKNTGYKRFIILMFLIFIINVVALFVLLKWRSETLTRKAREEEAATW